MESVLDRVIKQNTENVNLLKTKDYNIFSVLQIQSKERAAWRRGRVLKNFPERLSWNGKNGYKTGRSGNCDGRICD